MAPAKKRGAPASASKPERRSKKLTRKEKSAHNKVFFREHSRAAQEALNHRVAEEAEILHSAREGEPPATEWSEALGKTLFGLIVVGLSMDKISQRPGMPELKTMLVWLGNPGHPFGKLYKEAKALLVPLYEERAQDAALEATKSEVVTTRYSDRDGESREVKIVDNVERAKLKLTAYQWSLSHLLPKKHGRNADPEAGKPNDQLKALFDSLKQGPAE